MDRAALRSEVLQAAVAELDRVGPARFRVAVLADRFGGRGATRSTIYKWVADATASGKLGQDLARRLRAAATRHVPTDPDPAVVAAKATLDRLPMVTSIDDLAGRGPRGVADYLQECIGAARIVMAHARDPETGKPRMAKLLLFGSEHLRRCVETASRVLDKVHEIQKVEEFHRIIMEEVRKESPAVAMAILKRIDHVSQSYGAF